MKLLKKKGGIKKEWWVPAKTNFFAVTANQTQPQVPSPFLLKFRLNRATFGNCVIYLTQIWEQREHISARDRRNRKLTLWNLKSAAGCQAAPHLCSSRRRTLAGHTGGADTGGGRGQLLPPALFLLSATSCSQSATVGRSTLRVNLQRCVFVCCVVVAAHLLLCLNCSHLVFCCCVLVVVFWSLCSFQLSYNFQFC